jgi:hypothetical protein
LTAKEKSVGKTAICPHCRAHFPIAAPQKGGDVAAESGAVSERPPLPSGRPGEVSYPRAGDAARDDGAAARAASATVPAARPREAPSAADRLPPAAQRLAKTAKFIAAEPTSARVDLGADGRLPQLVLCEGPKSDAPEQEQQDKGGSARPLLLVAVFCFSIGVSVVMLLLDAGGARKETDADVRARQTIQQYYTGRGPNIEPYQQRLRQALQAHNQGDFAREQRLYREVLDLLHDESKNEFKGLTGMVSGGHTNDKDLEDLLSTLLR